MAQRTLTVLAKLFSKNTSIPDSKPTETFDAKRVIVPEPLIAFDWHAGEASQIKMMHARDLLIQAGNSNPSEAQIKAKYQAMGGNITS